MKRKGKEMSEEELSNKFYVKIPKEEFLFMVSFIIYQGRTEEYHLKRTEAINKILHQYYKNEDLFDFQDNKERIFVNQILKEKKRKDNEK